MRGLGKSRIGRWLLCCWCVVFACSLAACARDSSEQALRDTLDALQTAGEERDVSDFMAHVAEDFVGNNGEYDRVGLDRLLRMVSLRHQSIRVVKSGIEIEMHGDRAVVRMRILVTGGSGGLIPESGQLFDTESAWRFVDGDWMLGSAAWKPSA